MICIELTEEQLRAALDVIGKRVSETNEHGTPLFMAERELDSALKAYEEREDPAPMSPAEARAVKRAPITAGISCEFYAEMQQEYEPPDERMRRFTGQQVTVVRHLTREEYDGPGPDDDADEFDVSRAFIVRASDGTEFTAMEEELNGWDRDLGQYFWPDATYGPAHDTKFLGNERPDAS